MASQAAADGVQTYEQAISTAYESVRANVENLCAEYENAYQAASESFSGQFGLFDEASMKSEEYMNSTVSNAQAALDSQLAYWESYGANIETLKNTSASDLGITQENYEALMAYAQDGSEQAAGFAASMAAAIEAGDTEAVATLANTMAEVNAKQDEIAQSTADWQTNFTEQMNGYLGEMEGIIEDMNLSEEAAASATETVNSYAQKILEGKEGAVRAAQEVANAVTAALSSAKTTVNVGVTSSGVPGHAGGTTNAEDIFVAGEEGPELIVGAAHSTVFPTSETDRLINAVSSSYDNRVTSYTLSTPETGTEAETAGDQTKHITLEIAGGSPIEIGNSKGASKEEVVEILISNLRPALLNLVKEEIFEEGDGSYEY